MDDAGVSVERGGRFFAEPSAVSRTDTRGYAAISDAVLDVEPAAIVAPYLVVVVTDARHFSDIANDTYRLLPLRLNSRDLSRMHGTDERIGIREYGNAIRVYHSLVRRVSSR